MSEILKTCFFTFFKISVDFRVGVGYSIFTMTTNYSVGDNIRGSCIYRFGNELWTNIYEILDIETVCNFGKMEQLLTVNISITRGNITVIDKNVKRFSGQLFWKKLLTFNRNSCRIYPQWTHHCLLPLPSPSFLWQNESPLRTLPADMTISIWKLQWIYQLILLVTAGTLIPLKQSNTCWITNQKTHGKK